MKIKLKTRSRPPGTLGMWERVDSKTYRCGNVRIVLLPNKSVPANRHKEGHSWYIFVGDKLVMPPQRQWGYGHPSQAKIGASLLARHQRNKKGYR